MLDQSEKSSFIVLASIFIATWIAMLTIYFNVDFLEMQGFVRLIGFFTVPITAPFTALIIVCLFSNWFYKLTGFNGWLLAKSFWAKQVFAILPLINAAIVLYLK